MPRATRRTVRHEDIVAGLNRSARLIYVLRKGDFLQERFTTTRDGGWWIEGPATIEITRDAHGVTIEVL
jgi:hypothetical protein